MKRKEIVLTNKIKNGLVLLDNPEQIRKENVASKLRSLDRCKGSTDEELQDMGMYTH